MLHRLKNTKCCMLIMAFVLISIISFAYVVAYADAFSNPTKSAQGSLSRTNNEVHMYCALDSGIPYRVDVSVSSKHSVQTLRVRVFIRGSNDYLLNDVYTVTGDTLSVGSFYASRQAVFCVEISSVNTDGLPANISMNLKELVGPRCSNHEWSNMITTEEPTCSNPGKIYYTCKLCNENYFYYAQPAIGHNYNGSQVVKPTCLEQGYTLHTCAWCGATYKDNYKDALGHYLIKTETKLATCTEGGCNEYWTCHRCFKVFSDSVGQKETTVEAQRVAAKGHSWDDGTVTKEPTDTETGIRTFTCKNGCGEIKTETIGKKGHSFSSTWSSDDNYHWHACSTSGCKVVSEKSTHNWVEEITKQPTCKEEGEKRYTCSTCGKQKTAKIDKAEHEYGGSWYTTKATHCRVCKLCGVMEETAPHKWDKGVVVDSSIGSKVYTCTVCGYQTISVNPPESIKVASTSIKSLKASRKAISLKWNKKSVKGYQIQYSTSSSFKKGSATKTKTITSYKTTSKKITKLKAKKKYYVRVRCYKVVDGEKLYSDWSAKKSVKTK